MGLAVGFINVKQPAPRGASFSIIEGEIAHPAACAGPTTSGHRRVIVAGVREAPAGALDVPSAWTPVRRGATCSIV